MQFMRVFYKKKYSLAGLCVCVCVCVCVCDFHSHISGYIIGCKNCYWHQCQIVRKYFYRLVILFSLNIYLKLFVSDGLLFDLPFGISAENV